MTYPPFAIALIFATLSNRKRLGNKTVAEARSLTIHRTSRLVSPDCPGSVISGRESLEIDAEKSFAIAINSVCRELRARVG